MSLRKRFKRIKQAAKPLLRKLKKAAPGLALGAGVGAVGLGVYKAIRSKKKAKVREALTGIPQVERDEITQTAPMVEEEQLLEAVGRQPEPVTAGAPAPIAGGLFGGINMTTLIIIGAVIVLFMLMK